MSNPWTRRSGIPRPYRSIIPRAAILRPPNARPKRLSMGLFVTERPRMRAVICSHAGRRDCACGVRTGLAVLHASDALLGLLSTALACVVAFAASYG